MDWTVFASQLHVPQSILNLCGTLVWPKVNTYLVIILHSIYYHHQEYMLYVLYIEINSHELHFS